MKDCIELLLPFKAEYVSIARLAASGVANRLGFDIDAIEDIKVAVAEVCNKLVSAGSTAESYQIAFLISGPDLDILFDCDDKSLKCIFNHEEDALGIAILNALMDSVDFCKDNGYLFSMTKRVEGNI